LALSTIGVEEITRIMLTRAYKPTNCVISSDIRRLANKRIGISLRGFFDEMLV
jgi:hypothetical protein